MSKLTNKSLWYKLKKNLKAINYLKCYLLKYFFNSKNNEKN